MTSRRARAKQGQDKFDFIVGKLEEVCMRMSSMEMVLYDIQWKVSQHEASQTVQQFCEPQAQPPGLEKRTTSPLLYLFLSQLALPRNLVQHFLQ